MKNLFIKLNYDKYFAVVQKKTKSDDNNTRLLNIETIQKILTEYYVREKLAEKKIK